MNETLLSATAATEAGVVADLASRAQFDVPIDKPTVIVLPQGMEMVAPSIAAWRQGPIRATATYRPATVEAFIGVSNLYAADSTTVWVHPTSGRVEAVYDDNADDGTPAYREHRAVLQLQQTPEWAHWVSKDGQLGSQEDFALHIEAGLQEIEQPDAADLLEIAQSFHATTGATFRSALRLASGEQQFTYEESIEAKAGRSGQLAVPTTFVLFVAPFVGEEERQVLAKLRYRLSAGKLQIGYKLERPDKVVRDALDSVAEQLSGAFPRVFSGEPGA